MASELKKFMATPKKKKKGGSRRNPSATAFDRQAREASRPTAQLDYFVQARNIDEYHAADQNIDTVNWSRAFNSGVKDYMTNKRGKKKKSSTSRAPKRGY